MSIVTAKYPTPMRTSTNAVLARTVKPADAVNDIEGRLRRVMR